MKFTIKEAQIDDFQETHNSLNKFSDGLNIIYGKNEIGKSTLMNFIKRILTKDSDAKGYIKCTEGKDEYTLRAEKKSKKENPYPDKINPRDYKEGFVITLDDIVYASKKDAQSLVDTIKDSSGEGVKEKEKSLYGEIDSFIKMKSKGASAKLTPYFNKIVELNKKIKELQQKEEDYNNVCIKLENLDSELSKLKSEQKIAELVSKREELKKNITEILLNNKLLDNKDLFEKINNNFAILTDENAKREKIEADLENKKNEYNQTKKELDKLEFFDENELENFDLDKTNIKFAQEIIDKENDLNKEINNIESDIKILDKDIAENDTDLDSEKSKLDKIEIKDYEKFCADIAQLESDKSTFGELMEKVNLEGKNSKNGSGKGRLIIFFAILIVSVAALIKNFGSDVLWFMVVVTAISGVGIGCEIFNLKKKKNDSYSEELKNIKNESVKLCSEYGVTLDANNIMGQLGKQIILMNDKKTKYENIKDKIDDLEKISLKLKKEKSQKTSILSDLDNKKQDNSSKKEQFLADKNIQNIENYADIFEKISALREIKNKISEDEEKLSKQKDKKEDFVKTLNDFIKKSGLEELGLVTEYDSDYTQTVNKIKEILSEEIKKETKIASYTETLSAIEKEIKESDLSVIDTKDLDLEEIKTNIEQKTLEYGSTNREKQELESVTGLLDLKNKKNIAVNELKNFLKKLMEKEVMYNIIIKAKEKYNEIQPNLISAKEYLSEITDGKYNEIDFENKTISGEGIGDKDWDKLSRGTKEQLYLALRLGFAHNFAKDIDGNPTDIPNMPLIIDDAFVNFDSDRTRAILKCLNKISENNQVLFFTCHTDSIKHLLEQEKIKYNGIEL